MKKMMMISLRIPKLLQARANRSMHRSRQGFTLVELLVMVTLMTIMSALVVPSFSQILMSIKVRQAAGMLAGYIEQARLEAGTQNRPVEIRFYRDTNGGPYVAMQLYILRDAGMTAQTPLVRLPEGIAIANDERSSLLQEPDLGSGTSGALTYRSFEVGSNGETNLPRRETPLCLAVGARREITATGKEAPGLFAVLIDPVMATTRVVGR